MGVGFILFAILLMIIATAVIASVISGIVGLIFIKGTNRKRKKALAFIIPFVFVICLCFSYFILYTQLTEHYNVDLGIGDVWESPLNENCLIRMIDLTDVAYIECSGSTLASGISQIQIEENILYGINDYKEYFKIDLKSYDIIEYQSLEKLKVENRIIAFTPKKVVDVYYELRDELLGYKPYYLFLFSLVFSLALVYGLIKIVLNKS